MCSYCGSPMEGLRTFGFNETCSDCGKDLHVCLNCRHYAKGRRWDCHETIEYPVTDKDRRNHCDNFQVDPRLFVASEGRKTERSGSARARGDFDRLFGG